jgi:oligopeptide/dipeptide ABC transporter ATP-binding protein
MKADENTPLLSVRGLRTQFQLAEGLVRAVDGVDLTVKAGETLCVVGESGCGKSVMARSILQLVEPPGRITAGEIEFRPDWERSIDLAKLHPKGAELRRIRGKEIAMIFQEPMVSLSPVHTIGHQIVENLRTHENLNKREARERAIEELRLVGIPRPVERFDAYTFQLSGGMRQRAMIALALACRPKLLIADEPTTALDVTTQAQIIELLQGLQEQLGMAVMFITHDLGVVAEIADRVTVMYLGLVAEQCLVDDLFHDPKHPYTKALLRSVPVIGPRAARRLSTIRGTVPHPYNRPKGCPFHTRCDSFMPDVCDVTDPPLVSAGERSARCLLYKTPAELAGEEVAV